MNKQKLWFLVVWLLLNTLALSAESIVRPIVFDSELNSFSAVPEGDNYTSGKFYFVASDDSKYQFETKNVRRENGMLLVQRVSNYIKSPKIQSENGYVVTVRYYQSYTSGTTSISKLSYGTSSKYVLATKDGTKYGDYVGFVATLEVPYSTTFTFTTGTNNAYIHRIEIVPKTVKLDEGQDNAEMISCCNNKTLDISLTRTLVADKWNTFCVPFDIKNVAEVFKDAEIREYNEQKGVVENVMYFRKANDIIAGQPYLIKPRENIENPTFKDVTISEIAPQSVGNDDYKFVGVFSPLTFDDSMADNSLFLSGDERLVLPIPNTTMKGMRAYFSFPGNMPAQSAKISMENEETSITDIYGGTECREDKIFNLNGTCVGTSESLLPRGVYIKSGKKILK